MNTPDQYRPLHHIRPPRGWLNDPNGVIRKDNTTHVFFQHNPTAAQHHDIVWGHATTTDLAHWQYHQPALQPTPGYADESGCWSGVAIDEGQDFALIYSGVTASVQNLATPIIARRKHPDTDTWDQKTVINIDPYPPELEQVRDPFLITTKGRRFAVQGGGLTDGRACVILYDATDLEHWQQLSYLLTSDLAPDIAQANVWECPQLVEQDGKYLLLVSLWKHPQPNPEPPSNAPTNTELTVSAWISGHIDFTSATPHFHAQQAGLCDEGPDFYAPQIAHLDGKATLWGWSWESHTVDPAIHIARGYQGALTFPRHLTLAEDGTPQWKPAPELQALQGPPIAPTHTAHHHSWKARLRGVGSARVGTVNFNVDGETTVWVDGSLVEIFPQTPGSTPHTERTYQPDGVTLKAPGLHVECWKLS